MNVLAVSVLGAAVGVFAQEVKTTLALPPTPLLPATLGKLSRVAEGDAGDGLGVLDATDAAVLKEDGIRRFARSEYKDGGQHGTVTVYKFVDATGAVAAFDYFKRPGPVGFNGKLANTVASDGDGVVFRSGVNVVRENLNLRGAALESVTKELIDTLPKVGGPAAQAPLLPTLLPTKGLDAGTVRYAVGPVGYKASGGVLPDAIVGWDKAAETVTAKYAHQGTLTMLLYPTPQIAGAHGREIEAEMNREGAAAGTVKLRRAGPLVLLTTGAWSAEDAQAMVDGINLHQVVTFDKKMPLEFHAEVQKTYSLLTSIAALSGVLMLAAVILGLFFGGARAAIRVLQGKPAASEPEFLRIDLRGKTAPIHLDGPGAEPQG
jgi:hypothetical protein